MTVSVTLTRTGYSLWAGTTLALSPLVIDGNPSTGAFHITEEDVSWPAFQINRNYVPDSDAISGRVHNAAVVTEGSVGLKIAAHGSDWGTIKAAMDELMAATSQFTYDLTLTVDGVAFGPYQAKAELPLWGALDSGMVRGKLNEATIAIPLNPPAAGA